MIVIVDTTAATSGLYLKIHDLTVLERPSKCRAILSHPTRKLLAFGKWCKENNKVGKSLLARNRIPGNNGSVER
jgi:hypothetical protein